MRALPSAIYLNARLAYFSDSGELIWKVRPAEHFSNSRTHNMWNARFAEKLALSTVNQNGYRHGSIDGVSYLSHRVIWKLVTGKEPAAIVDHEDRDTLNNRWGNLREATESNSTHNRITRDFMGIDRHRRKWRARIVFGGKEILLGLFYDKHEALRARVDAERHYFGEFSPR